MTSEHTEAPDLGQPAAPRYALAWAMLACAVAALTLAYPALSGGFLVNTHSDQYIAGYAFRDYAAQMLRESGSFPLWNPYLFGGMPYVDAMHGDIFYPTFLLRMLLPTDVAMTWGMILHFWLAGVATYAFLRANNLSFHASLIGGLAYMMSGQVAGLVSPGHDGKLFITALFPVTLLVLRHGVRGGKPWAWGVLGLVVGLGVLTPHPQLLQYLLLGGGAYALWMAYLEKGDGAPTPQVATKRLAFALGAVMIGFAIGAVQFMPLAQYTPWSPRAGGAGWEHAISFSMPPEELVNWIIPQFSGILEAYWGRNGIHFHSEYIGVPALLLAAAAFATRDPQHRRFMWFLAGMLGVSAIWAMGGFVEPFYRLVYLIPGTKYFRAPSTIMFMSAFAVAALAAIGAQRMLAAQITKRLAIGAAISIGVVTLLGVTGGLTNAFEYAALANPRGPEGALQAMEMNKSAVAAGAWRMAFFGGIALALLHAAYNKALRPHVVAYLFAGLVVADLWSIERHYWLFSPRAAQIFGTDAAIDRIKADSQPGRVYTLDFPSAEAAPRDPFLNGDGMMSNAVRHVAGYHGNEMGRYQDLYGGKDRHLLGVLQRLAEGDVYAQLTNLRWVYTNVPSLPPDAFPRMADVKPVLGPVRNSVGTNVWLYRVPGDNPPAWVVPAMLKAPDNAALAYLSQPDFPVKSVGLFDTSSAVQGEQLTAAPAPLAINARMTRYAPGSIDIELDAPAPARSGLIVSENFYPGWSATVDGKPVTAERADYVLIGVPLPTGARKVELRFSDSAYTRGKLVTLLAIALGAALAIGGAVVGRRKAAA